MKKVRIIFGILFVILGVVMAPKVLAPTLPETLGGITGWLLVCALPAFLLLRKRKKKETNSEEEGNKQ